jgi:hypothetical protein
MNERERFDAQREAKNEAAGPTSRSTRERIAAGLNQYLSAEARHARKAAKEEQERERWDRG